MDLDSIAADLAADHGLGSKKSDGTYDAIAEELARDHGVKHTTPEGRARVYITAPPISGATKEESNAINEEAAKRPIYKGGPQTSSISQIPIDAGNKVVEGLGSVASQGSAGLGDILSNKPASGVGKIGSAALTALGIPADVVSSVGSNLTGSEEIGNKLGLLSGVLPVAKVGSLINNALPRNKAINELVNKITSNGRDYQALADTVQSMKADPRIGPADTSPAVLNMGQKLFTTEGDAAKNYLFNASKDRVSNLPQDVTHAYNEAGGVPVNVVQKLSDLSQASKKVGDDMINPALAKAKPVNISNTLSAIDDTLKPGVLKVGDSVPLTAVKKELVNIRQSLRTSKEYNANDLHKFQSGLRKTAQNMLSSPDGNTRAIGYELSKVRNNLVKDIDDVAPGYKAGLSAYKDEKDIAEAFRHSHDDIFNKSTKMENAPEVTEKWFNSLTDHEKEAAREGARLAVRSRMGVSDNSSLAGTNFARSEFNQEKLKTIFGKDETEKLLKDLENTRSIKNTDQKIIEGSQTEMRRAGDDAIALTKDKPKKEGFGKYVYPAMAAAGEYYSGGTGLAALGTGALATTIKAGSAAKSKITDLMEKERNLHLAKMILPVEGEARNKLISDLESFLPQPKQSLLTRVARKLPISP